MTKNNDAMGERLAKIETTLDYVKESLDNNDKDHKIIMAKVDKFIESADSKYASKLTEKVMWGLIGLIVTAVIVAILKNVIV